MTADTYEKNADDIVLITLLKMWSNGELTEETNEERTPKE
jgi:hypothetical protein